jgi:hypothetical protein
MPLPPFMRYLEHDIDTPNGEKAGPKPRLS